ncbi:MAG: UDP-N-acetylmuramoyl-L-alanine--D-glutamate ligase [Pseudomonadota bacterium]|nr:UDP-N-acetylmuramoyl-L-alanine--D-glutamate ligase [Pseudomonadota bacterium]
MTANAPSQSRYLIIGLGLTGLSCARFCQQRGLDFTLCDTRSELPGMASILAEFEGREVILGLPDDTVLEAHTELLVSPGIDTNTPYFHHARELGCVVSGDIQLFHEYCDRPVIAITGSNGKSTVTTLVAELLKAAGLKAHACGNIGVPALDLLTASTPADIYVLELSSFQLETTRDLSATVASILNISPDHMDRYQKMPAYERAKQRIFQGAKAVVVNADDDHTLPVFDQAAKALSFSVTRMDTDYHVQQDEQGSWLMRGQQRLLNTRELKIQGLHNVANVLAALAMVEAAGVDIKKTLTALTSFTGLPHRCQWIADVNGVAYFNDSKGTNVGSTVAAIHGLSATGQGKLWLLAGGEGKGQAFAELADACDGTLAGAYLFGADRDVIASDLSKVVPCQQTSTLDEALAQVAQVAQSGDMVLFSPACASFDQFKNYVQRGEYFCQLVEALS